MSNPSNPQYQAQPRAARKINDELSKAIQAKQAGIPFAKISDGKVTCPGCNQEAQVDGPPGAIFTSVPLVCSKCKTKFQGFTDSEDNGEADGEEGEGDTGPQEPSEAHYILTEAEGHEHEVRLDADGNGTSSEDNDHTHKVAKKKVQKAKGHTHGLQKADMPSMDDMLNQVLFDNGDEEDGGLANIPEHEVIAFFLSHPNPTDDMFHAHSEQKGWNNHAAEAKAYELATRYAMFRMGGQSGGVRPESVDDDEEMMGQQVELEHTANKDDALKIAWDHLAEVPESKYYTFLETIEKILKAGPKHPLYEMMVDLTQEAKKLPSGHE